MNPILTIVGASARAAAQSAARAGFCVRAGDLFADADLTNLCEATRVDDYPAGLAAVVTGPQPGAWMYAGALENHPSLVDVMASSRTLWGNPAAVLRRVRDPRLVADALAASGLATAGVELDVHKVPRDGTWLCKPRRSAGGARIAFWTRESPVSRPRVCYFQQFVEGSACSAVYVAARGRAILLGVTRQLIGQPWTGASSFRYCGSIGPISVSSAAAQSFAAIGNVLARAFGLVGLFGVDAVVNAAGVWPVEVNPRYTASVEVLERAGNVPAIEWHAAACQHGRLPGAVEPTEAVSGKAILFAAAPVAISAEWSAGALAAQDAQRPVLADIPQAGARIEAHAPIVTVLADGHDETAVLATLGERAAAVLRTLCR